MTSDTLPVVSAGSAAPTLSPVPALSPAEAAAAEVDALVASLRPRLADAVSDAEVDRLVREARADLGPVRVTTYLPILVERRVRQRMRTAQAALATDVIDAREARVTA